MWVVKIDNREQKLMQLFQGNNQSVNNNTINLVDSLLEPEQQASTSDKQGSSGEWFSFEQLEHGDFQFWYQDKLVYILERKTIADLQASIKDGRYKNQKASVLQLIRKEQFFYILEGSTKFAMNAKASDKPVHGAIINNLLRDHIGFFYTKTTEETHQLICSIYHRLKEQPSVYLDAINLEKQPEYKEQIITTSRNKMETSSDCWKYQLCQIPEISEKTAEAILQTFPTCSSFYKFVFASSSNDQVQTQLSSIKLTDEKGKKRKISSAAVSSIIKFMCENVDTVL